MIRPLLDLLRCGRLVALVGGGGKTTTAERLVVEAAQRGSRAIFTTTTKTFAGAPFAVRLFDSAKEAAEALRPGDLPALVARKGDRADKLEGFAPEEIPALFAAADFIAVEADGARRMPLKAFGPGEPPLPPGVTDYLPVLGLAALGRTVEEGVVHHPERFAEKIGVARGSLITEDVLVRAICGANGYLSAAPEEATVTVLLWGATGEEKRIAAGRLARRLLEDGRIDRVVAGDLLTGPPDFELFERNAGSAAQRAKRAGGRMSPSQEKE